MDINTKSKIYEDMDGSFQIQCFSCGSWLPSYDVGVSLEGYIPFMTNYEYTCSDCGVEAISKKAASFFQVGITALANLTARYATHSPPRLFFSLEKEIIPFVWENWDFICTKRSKTSSWRNNLATKLTSPIDVNLFKACFLGVFFDLHVGKIHVLPSTETRIFCEKAEDSGEFGLLDQDLSIIGPRRYESKTLPQKGVGKVKRKATDNSQISSAPKKVKGDTSLSSKSLLLGYPLEHPYNKDGYRYILAEKDPHANVEMDLEDMAGRPIPPELYRPSIGHQVLLALHDRAPQLKVAENRLTVTGEKGYRMIRATHGVTWGTWYFEVHIDDLSSVVEGAVRLGWSQCLGNLQATCGYDKLSYSWRSKLGTKFHQSRGEHYSDGYTTGDTVGFLIHLPKRLEPTTNLPPTHKDKALIKFKNFFYFEEKDDSIEEFEKGLRPLKGSKIIFYNNGVSQGLAWSDIYAGRYFPTLSLYRGVTVTANFGPSFKYSPSDVEYKPISDAARVAAVEQSMSEMLFRVESTATKELSPIEHM